VPAKLPRVGKLVLAMACPYFWIAYIWEGLPKIKKCHYYGNMTGNMTQNSPNMFPTFPMKYFGVPNGCL